MRRGLIALLAVLAAVGSATIALAGSGGERRTSAAARSVSVSVLTTSQRDAMGHRVLRMRIRSSRPAVVRIVARARRAAGGPARTITRSRRVRFRRGGRRTIRLRLTRFGRRMLSSCGATRLSISVRGRVARRGARRIGRRGRRLATRSRSKRLRRNASHCWIGSPSVGGGGSGEGPGGGGPGGPGGGTPGGPGGGGSGPKPLGPVSTANADRCDFLDPSVCLYPWPNDHFTEGASTATGRRLDLNELSMPRNRPTGTSPEGKPIDPTDQNRADGFSPGNKIITRVPGLDNQEAFNRTGAVPIWDMNRSFDPEQPVVVINARTRERHLIWAEVDANPENPADRTLIIRPGTNFEEGQRYIVALRNLRDRNGRLLQPREEFRAYRDNLQETPNNPALDARRPHFEDIFDRLADAGIERQNLYLAWDFTVASRQSLTGRMLSMRDDAFGGDPALGPALGGLDDSNLADLTVQGVAPTIVPTTLETTNFAECGNDGCQEGEDDRIARRVEGRIFVPCYLDSPKCAPGGRFQLNPATGLPVRNPTPHEAAFRCDIPRVALEGPTTGQTRVSLYGHGLLGNRDEMNQGQLKDFASEHNIAFCGTEWAGMACGDMPIDPFDPQGSIADLFERVADGTLPQQNAPNCDIPTIFGILQDLSEFPKLADRGQQGMLNFLYLGRLMVHPDGLSALPEFRRNGQPILDTRRLFYDGNSQGGIMGGGLAAVAVDHERAVLGVPGMNYSTLLRRSVDFDTYARGEFGTDTPFGLYDNYPNELERPLIISLIQLLWDRAEANGYAHHMTDDPLPNTPRHQVMLHVGFGDHQVADVTTEVEARTIGARVHRPVLDADRPRYRGRPPGEKSLSFVGIPSLFDGWRGSALVFFDIGPRWSPACGASTDPPNCDGLPPPHPQNIPPREGEDPHEWPRRTVHGRLQKSEFLKVDGAFVDTCGGKPCYARNWTGPGP